MRLSGAYAVEVAGFIPRFSGRVCGWIAWVPGRASLARDDSSKDYSSVRHWLAWGQSGLKARMRVLGGIVGLNMWLCQ